MAPLELHRPQLAIPKGNAAVARVLLSTLALGAVLISLSCTGSRDEPTSDSSPATSWFAEIESTDWVRLYKPESAFNGYTLAFYKRRIPILMDMNGRIVHSWPQARTRSRIRLLEDGTLLALTLEGGGRRV